MIEQLKAAKPGSVLTISKRHERALDPIQFFAKLSNFGKKKHSLLIEFKDKTIGTADPALMVRGKGPHFEIIALSETGKRMLSFLRHSFSFADKMKYSKDSITGTLPGQSKAVTDEQFLKAKTHFDVLRSISFSFKHLFQDENAVAGLYGMIGSEFMDMAASSSNLSQDASYTLYFVDNAFVIDHAHGSASFVCTAIMTDSSKGIHELCEKKLKWYERIEEKKLGKQPKSKQKKASPMYDLSDEDYIEAIKEIRKQIVHGAIIQLNPSRQVTFKIVADPLQIYQEARNPKSGYSFYLAGEDGIFMGSQPSLHVTVSGSDEKQVALSTISTARPRGYEQAILDLDLVAKKEVRIWADENDMIQHLIALDASRNIISEVSVSGSCQVTKMFAIEKQDQFQYMYATVQGILKQNHDALHAIQASLGSSAGIPKKNAIEMLRKIEKTKRGLFSGSFVQLHVDGTMQSILLEPIHFKKDILSFRTSASIVHHGNYPTDLQKSQREEDTVLNFVMKAGGSK